MLPVILNFVFFNTVYAASLAGVVLGQAWLGVAALGCFMLWHGFTVRTARADFLLALTAVGIGFVLDTLYVQAGLISYEGNLLWSGAAPLWILALWANFALTMNGCMGWLQTRKPLAALLAFIFGPLSYFGGIALGAATVTGQPWQLYTSIGVAWAAVLPLLLSLAARYAQAGRASVTYSA